MKKTDTVAWTPTMAYLKNLLPPIVANRHKYQAGYVVGYAGSKVFQGSLKLSGIGALRAGAGIVRIFCPEEIENIPYELIVQKWEKKAWEKEVIRASSFFVGPGLTEKAIPWLKRHLPFFQNCVVDAGALQPKLDFPKNAILTPHLKEALHLFGLKEMPEEEELFAICQAFCKKRDLILVLKGAPSYVFNKEHRVVIPFGDPAMATAGSGDILTGILAAFLAQKVSAFDAAVLGASLHALTGKIAAQQRGSSYGMLASDLFDFLPQGFKQILTGDPFFD